MNSFTKENITHLQNAKEQENLSIYIPTYRANNDEQNRIGFKNAMKEAEATLKEHGYDEEAIKNYLKPIYALNDKEHFWDHQSDGLIIFRNKNLFEFYTLPVDCEAFTFFGSEFYIRPLMQILGSNEIKHVMTVSPNNIRLVSLKNHSVYEHDLSNDFPENMEESMWHMDREATQQGHGANKSLYHGQGSGKDSKEEDIKRFFRDVNTGLESFFSGKKETLILAGVDDTVRLFKSVFKYNHIAEEHISGNHDDTPILILQEHAQLMIEKQDMLNLHEEIHEIADLLHTERTETQIEEIVKMSEAGRIEKLMIKENEHVWGYFDTESNSVKLKSSKTNGEIDLLNTAATKTILNGGEVEVVPVELMEHKFEGPAVAYYRH